VVIVLAVFGFAVLPGGGGGSILVIIVRAPNDRFFQIVFVWVRWILSVEV
jgi:hypothetical protein